MMWLHEGFPNVHNDLKLKIPVGNGNDKKSPVFRAAAINYDRQDIRKVHVF